MATRDGITALLLAGGYSSRMQRFKPLLPLGASTVLGRAVDTFRTAGVRDVTVVVGHRGEELRPVIEGMGARCVVNAGFAAGMYSSLVAGIRSLGTRATACFVLPADMPAVRSRTVALLAKAHGRTSASVLYPTFRGRRGHPPLLSSSVFPAIASGTGEGGLRHLLAQWEPHAREVSVVDEGILIDVDTPEDYAFAAYALHDRAIPTVEECEAILERARVPDAVVRHGRCVSRVARRLAAALGEAGFRLDLRLVIAGGLLHDVARLRPDHARAGARRLERLGFPRLASVVASHMDLAFEAHAAVDEAAIVYLADKLVCGDRTVSLAERFQRARADAQGIVDATRAVETRWNEAQADAREVERVLGCELTEVARPEPPPALESRDP